MRRELTIAASALCYMIDRYPDVPNRVKIPTKEIERWMGVQIERVHLEGSNVFQLTIKPKKQVG